MGNMGNTRFVAPRSRRGRPIAIHFADDAEDGGGRKQQSKRQCQGANGHSSPSIHFALQFETTEPERVSNDRNRAERHRRACDHRAEQQSKPRGPALLWAPPRRDGASELASRASKRVTQPLALHYTPVLPLFEAALPVVRPTGNATTKGLTSRTDLDSHRIWPCSLSSRNSTSCRRTDWCPPPSPDRLAFRNDILFHLPFSLSEVLDDVTQPAPSHY